MRWSLLLLLFAIPTTAFAEPKVAIAPLDGDDGKVVEVVVEVASRRADVTKPGRVEGAMRSLGVSKLSPKSTKKLRNKLDVEVVIYGTVEKSGGEKRLSLQMAGSGKSKLEIDFKSTKELRKELAAKLPPKIAAATEGGDSGEEDEEEERTKREAEERKKREEEEAKKREEERLAEERRKKDEEDRRKKDEDERRADRKKRDDDDRRKKRGDDEDEEEDDRRATRKKRGDDEEEDEDDGRRKKRVADAEDQVDEGEDEDRPRRKKKKREQRHVLTQAALWLDAGGAVARRTLTYSATGNMRPPRVGTAAPAGRIAGELYPGAFSSLKGPLAGIGIAGEYSRTFALGIAVPGTQVTAPIKNGHYSIGARYRFTFGEHSLALGVAYWRSYYMADRSGLMSPDLLDMPDVDYSAVAPGVVARIAATPKVGAFASVNVPLMLYSGPIQDPASYGSAKILALDIRAGAQIVLASHVGLQLGFDFEQIGLSFTRQAGSLSETRMVSKATDRSIGFGATIGVAY